MVSELEESAITGAAIGAGALDAGELGTDAVCTGSGGGCGAKVRTDSDCSDGEDVPASLFAVMVKV